MNPVISRYLAGRPAFFSFIRPQEVFLFSYFQSLFKGKVLDFGCGDGFFADIAFGRRGKRRLIDVGIDVYGSRIKEAEKYKIYKKLVEYDGSILPYRSDIFTTIVSNCVLEHIPDVSKSIEEIYRVLSPGGFFLTGVMTDQWERFMLGPYFLGDYYRETMRKRQEHVNLFSVFSWDRVFTEAGFTIEHRIGYLSPSNARLLDLWHYLSAPSLVSHAVFNKWVLWEDWHKLFPVSHMIYRTISQSIGTPLDTASAVFYVLRKE